MVSDILDLSSNENPLGPSPGAVEAVQAAASAIHRYPDPMAGDLRAALARHHGVEPGQVLTDHGAESVIGLICRSLLEPGDEAVMPNPSFPVYRTMTVVGHGSPVEVPLRDGQYDVDAILSVISARTRLVFLANPNNPTGDYLGQADLDTLRAQLPDRAMIVLDEAYRLYAEADDVPDGIVESRADPRVLVLRTFSKTYGLAGLRVGYLLGAAEVVDLLARVRDAFAVNSLAQVAAVAALDDEHHLEATLRTNRESKARLVAALRERELARTASEGNFLWVDTGRDASEVWSRLLDRGVVVRNGALWKAPRHLRVTIGTPPQVDRFVAALDSALAGTDAGA